MATQVEFEGKTICFMNKEAYSAFALLTEKYNAVNSDNIRLKSTNETLKEEIVKLKTQMLPNELEQNVIEAMDEGRTLKEK